MSQRVSNFDNPSQLRSSSSGTSNTPDQPPCEYIDGVRLDWSGRGTSHVDYDKSDVLPLTQGDFLGHGMNGGVYETTCRGIRLAWKRKHCRRKIGEREMREIEIIKKVSHRHIIRLMGTYTHGPFLGLLLWPVATCDLATLLEDVEWLQTKRHLASMLAFGRPPPENWDDHATDRQARLEALGVAFDVSFIRAWNAAVGLLQQTIGCIVGAVAYLHSSGIKHKDLKPSNILLSGDGLWLTDFGTATDFSVLTSSVTDEGERGTPKYFSPEVANFTPSGRPADVFSLGCILFEVLAVCENSLPGLSQELRRSHDRSFHSNLDTIVAYMEGERLSKDSAVTDDYLTGLVRWMMEEEAAMRPTADVVEQEVLLINGLGFAFYAKRVRQNQHWGFYRPCCFPEEHADRRMGLPPNLEPMITINVTYGRSYIRSNLNLHYAIYLEHTGGGLVERVHLFTVSALGDNSMRGRMLRPRPAEQKQSEISYSFRFTTLPNTLHVWIRHQCVYRPSVRL